MRLDRTLGREQDQQQISAAPSQQDALALDIIVSNLSVVVGSLANPTMQGQAAAAGFWAKKNMGYNDNDVTFVKGICHVFKPRYMPELWKEWDKTNNFFTGRNILMRRMRMFATRTGMEIDPSIYIENSVMEELTKTKFSAGDVVPRFNYL